LSTRLEGTNATLQAAGFEILASPEAGNHETALQNHIKVYSADLLVMGAYGHSHIRQWIVGSTTTTLPGNSNVPALVLR
jgi:nucleotide-binding universal stress UspA family protein